uniref:Mitochondrial proton/calcium exchanger protein n=1 Tax=Spongospora subterranea TaxID=70186 RepID=A0A0H5R6Q7_9EUKA|eukprot:CRZ09800.1 hypothetical protein [Spongospora subterranea]
MSSVRALRLLTRQSNALHCSPYSTGFRISHHPLRPSSVLSRPVYLHCARRFLSTDSTDSKNGKQTRLEVIKGVLVHYWNGSKLLAANVSTAAKLVRKSTTGEKLSRRERKLLAITAADLARLVPFAFFVIIPFMELLLPFALMLFPNMLPSTFQDKHKKEENMKKQLKLRLELAEFLQETTEVVAKDIEKRSNNSQEAKEKAERLIRLLGRVRQGKFVTNDDLRELASLFEDQFTLEHLSREQLLSLCRYMGLPTYGTETRLRYELLKRLDDIRDDDRAIIEEGGIFSLNLPELRSAVQHRGMRALGVDEIILKSQLQSWLDLSSNKSIPPLLLILSRVFTLNQTENPAAMEAIKSTLAQFDEKIVEEAIDETLKPDGHAEKLEDVKFQLELLKEEEADKKAKQVKDVAGESRANSNEVISDESDPETLSKIKDIGEDLAVLSDESAVVQEREKLQQLTAKWKDGGSSAKEPTVIVAPKTTKLDIKEKSSAKEADPAISEIENEKTIQTRLQQKIGNMLAELRADIDKADSKIGDKLNVLDRDHDGVMSYDEVVSALKNSLKDCKTDEEAREIVKKLDIKKDGKIDTEELREFIRKSNGASNGGSASSR